MLARDASAATKTRPNRPAHVSTCNIYTETEVEALREQVAKLTADVNTLGQLVILGRGRYQRGCRLCGQTGQKPEPGDPPIMDIEREYHRNGHHFVGLTADTQRALDSRDF
jgi:hypothetical protein